MAKKPNKRIQKKTVKKSQNKKLSSKGLSEKEIKKLTITERKKTIQKIEKSEKKSLQYQQNKEYLLKNNITSNYIINGKKYTPSKLANLSPVTLKKYIDDIKRQQRNQRQNEARKIREENNIQRLLENGIDYEQAKKNKRLSQKNLEQLIFLGDRNVYVAEAYLSVMWSDVTGESQLQLALNEFNDLSTKQMIEKIQDIYNNVQADGSDFFKGVPKIEIHKDINYMQSAINDGYFRGYDQKMVTEKEFLLMSNEWTLRGYANMMLSIMSRTSNDLIRNAYNHFEHYAYMYLPEIHKQIFN